MATGSSAAHVSKAQPVAAKEAVRAIAVSDIPCFPYFLKMRDLVA